MKTRILVVEDDPMISEMMDIILSQAGYDVVVAATGEAAMDVLGRMRFSLVLMDYQMPRMSGLEVVATMKRKRRAMPPVIMVTADRNVGTVQQAVQLGCVGYVAKPFTPELLRTRVRMALKGAAAEAEADPSVVEV